MASQEPASVPIDDPAPFAEPPKSECYWPLRSSDSRRLDIAYEATDGTIIVNEARYFHAPRQDRYHAGVDLYGNPGDALIACEDGRIVNFYSFYEGTYALIVEFPDKVVNYGEVADDSLTRTGLRVNDTVEAGEVIGAVGRLGSGNSMCHFETYVPGTTKNESWPAGQNPSARLLNPTKYLLFLKEHGVAIDVARAMERNLTLGQSLGWEACLDKIARLLSLSSVPAGPDSRDLAVSAARWQRTRGLTEDGIIGSTSWGKLKEQLGV